MFQKVLLSGKIDSSFSFIYSNEKDGYSKTTLKYLGAIETKDQRQFKLVTYEYIWGPNLHTSGSIYVFNRKNQYVGKYYVGGGQDLPIKLKNDCLIFTNDDDVSCDKNLITSIILKYGLPKKIFIKCKGQFGNLYSFSSED